MDIDSPLLDHEPLSEDTKSRARTAVLAGAAAATRRRRRALQSSVVLSGVLVAAGVLVYPAVFSAPSAYASWTAVPRPTSLSVGDPRLQTCTSSIPTGPAQLVGTAQSLTPVVAEERGAFTAALLGGGDSIAICIFDETNRSSGRTVAVPLPAGDSVSIVGNGGSLDDGEGARYVYGRVGKGVTSVVVVTTDGLRVTASVSGGYYLAWWPAPAGPATVTASGSEGRVMQEVLAS